jgi:hypothetical protein
MRKTLFCKKLSKNELLYVCTRVIRKPFFKKNLKKPLKRPQQLQTLSKNTSGSEQLWCRAPPFAPKDSVFAQQVSNKGRKVLPKTIYF